MSEPNYDRLEETMPTGDKDELIEDGSHTQGKDTQKGGIDEFASLQKSKKVIEAGKAVMSDQSRGLRIIVICAFIFSFIITVALILSIYLGPPQIGANAAVASDIGVCSQIGLDALKKGGNAVDAAVAAMFCMGVVNAESSGLGGGGFMLVHDHKNEKSEVFDFRETAPDQATADMFVGNEKSKQLGGLAAAVPGELKGMEVAHKKYGKLSWSAVVTPAANLARNGFSMTGHTAYVLSHPDFEQEHFMKSKLCDYYCDGNGQLKEENDLIVREDLAATLDKIAADGSDVFYTGQIADDIVNRVQNDDIPGIMTKDDLVNYEVEVREVVQTTFHKYTVESTPAPSSGPVLLSIMNLLEHFNLKKDAVSYHRMLEAFKFGYAFKEQLGDPKYNTKQILNASNVMISKEEALKLLNLTSNVTMPASFYSKATGLPADHGTAQVSVIDTSELMVSVTTTVNTWFGSMVLTDSGILLNNEMADFSDPGVGNTHNEIRPGKRPQSSMTPTVVYETGHLCGLRMVLGAVNGSRIITGVAQTLLNNLTLGMNLEQSISAPRLHSQLTNPDANVTEAEEGFLESILDGLSKMGHVIQLTDKEQSAVTAVLKIKDNIIAVSDKRKKGANAAIFK